MCGNVPSWIVLAMKTSLGIPFQHHMEDLPMTPYRASQSENEWPKNPFLIHERISWCQRRWRATTRPSLNSVDALQGAPSVQSIESPRIGKTP